jgi:hypothetical protein
MPKQRQNLERQALEGFEKIARKHRYPVFKGQGSDNRIRVDGNTYFQFGDLRVDVGNYYVVIEVESAGGVTNLVKYWQCLENRASAIEKPVVLFHVFRQGRRNDYGSHLALWDFMWSKMNDALGDTRIKAARYTYRDLNGLEPVINEFEKYLKHKA